MKIDDRQPYSEGLAQVWIDGKWGYIDKSRRVVIRPQFYATEPFSDGMASVSQGDKIGFIDRKGKLVIPFRYWDADRFVNGRCLVRRGGGRYRGGIHAMIDRKGNVVAKLAYRLDKDSFLGQFHDDGAVQIRCPEGAGFLDQDLKPVGGRLFDYVLGDNPWVGGRGRVEADGKTAWLYRDGRLVWPRMSPTSAVRLLEKAEVKAVEHAKFPVKSVERLLRLADGSIGSLSWRIPAFSFHFDLSQKKPAEKIWRMLDQVRDALPPGFSAYWMNEPADYCDEFQIAVQRSLDPYDFVREHGMTNIENCSAVATLKAWSALAPFDFLGTDGSQWFALRFKRLPKDLDGFCRHLDDIFPDGSASDVKSKLRRTKRLSILWG